MGTLCFRELLHKAEKQLGGLGHAPPGNLFLNILEPLRLLLRLSRAHKNGRLEEKCVTPIEARSPGKIIEPY